MAEDEKKCWGLIGSTQCFQTVYGAIFYDKSNNINMIVQQIMTLAISNRLKLFLAPDVELRQGRNKIFSVIL